MVIKHETKLNIKDYRVDQLPAFYIMRLAEEHKEAGCDGNCNICLGGLYQTVRHILERPLTIIESNILM